MPDKLRIGIVGLGFGAAVHLPAFSCLPAVKVIAVADPGLNRGFETYARKGTKCHLQSWEDIIHDNDIDAISVAVPPFAQSDIICHALAAGKHVLCEKPFGLDVNEAATMLRMAREKKVIHAVDFQFRMETGIYALKREIAKGIIGEIRHIDVEWLTEGGINESVSWSWRNDMEQGGGVLGALGSHVIDYLTWMLDAKINEVSAKGQIVIPFRKDSRGLNRKVTAEDSLEIFCKFINDIPVQIKISNCCKFLPRHRIEINGSKGKFIYVHEKPFTPEKMSLQLETCSGKLCSIKLNKPPLREGMDTRLAPFMKLAGLFVKAINGKVCRDLPSFMDGYEAQVVMAAVRRSMQLGRMVGVEGEMNLSPIERNNITSKLAGNAEKQGVVLL
jgi:predicted dehydrogenase